MQIKDSKHHIDITLKYIILKNIKKKVLVLKVW